MDHKEMARLNVYAEVFKALAHPIRLFLVKELSRGEGCVCDLKSKAGADMPTISKHLSILKKAGLVSDERRGTWVFYRLETPKANQIVELVESLTKKNARQHLELVS